MKIISHLLLGLAATLICCPVSAAPSEEGTALVYSDSYVWYLANRLADTAMSRAFTQPLPPDIASQYHFELALLYHHGIVACDGPLDEIADAIKFSALTTIKSDESTNPGDILNALGTTDNQVQSILGKWNATASPQFFQVFRARKASTAFPKCTNPHYVIPRAQ
ncbi:hypothetical protein [Burkholderia ubonensis]|uniref:hypothetical protein n=1 Tax=Burkholderia ubonensis TaxID=101571 RepID=UPI001453AD93|nr:hypothetical protein [Burkholderia ubonensis]VWB37406.1 hypothetical protein BUB20358_01628 [Burkholderia ubonensis]